jgi:hypothetical protein
MLDCYICGKSLLVYVYAAVYVCLFWRLSAGDTDKIGIFFKKNLMFSVHLGTKGLCSSGFPEEHKPLMFLGSPMNVSSIMFLGSSRNVSSVMFLGSLRNVSSYVPQP